MCTLSSASGIRRALAWSKCVMQRGLLRKRQVVHQLAALAAERVDCIGVSPEVFAKGHDCILHRAVDELRPRRQVHATRQLRQTVNDYLVHHASLLNTSLR